MSRKQSITNISTLWCGGVHSVFKLLVPDFNENFLRANWWISPQVFCRKYNFKSDKTPLEFPGSVLSSSRQPSSFIQVSLCLTDSDYCQNPLEALCPSSPLSLLMTRVSLLVTSSLLSVQPRPSLHQHSGWSNSSPQS